MRAFRNDAGAVGGTADFLGAQSLIMCIAGFLYAFRESHNASLEQSTRDFQNWTAVKLCGSRPVQLLQSGVPETVVIPDRSLAFMVLQLRNSQQNNTYNHLSQVSNKRHSAVVTVMGEIARDVPM
jgi:hypothetical protein